MALVSGFYSGNRVVESVSFVEKIEKRIARFFG